MRATLRKAETALKSSQTVEVRISNIAIINAVLYFLENGCKWRALPKRFGKWHSVYARFRRRSRGGWNTKIHMVSASDKQAMTFRLSGGHAHDAPEGRALLKSWDNPVVPPKANRKVKWNYDRETYKLRNEIERLFRRFKGCRRLFTRFDKLDATYRGFLNLAAVVEMIYDLA